MARACIFGAGPAGLYTALRLLESGTLTDTDTLELFDWGAYDFDGDGTRAPAGRICTTHYRDDPDASYIELGGMRYLEWDHTPAGPGHRLVTLMIEQMGLNGASQPFNTTVNPLFFLRAQNFYSDDIDRNAPAPYNTADGLANHPPDNTYDAVATDAIDPDVALTTRAEQCAFYTDGRLPASYTSHVFEPGQRLRDIGYWNLFYDAVGNEAYRYADMGGGYSSNTINWNSADALIYNSEFAPGGVFKTLSTGYSSLFSAMFQQLQALADQHGVDFQYHPRTRLHSVLAPEGAVRFQVATADAPDRGTGWQEADHAFLAMPPRALDLVAQATRYASEEGDVLNADRVALYRESVCLQPSYKIALFFASPWWEDARYAPDLVGEDSDADVYGPTITDTPLRQVYYFGDNGKDKTQPVYGMLASYDDETFVRFWQELEVGPRRDRHVPLSRDLQPLHGPKKGPRAMVQMLRTELARLHFGPEATIDRVPEPLETRYMDWSLNPFGAGYHAWAAHYDVCDVMNRIRQPTSLTDGPPASLYIVGSAYSNDQAWVEGAFCTAESVLVDFFNVTPITDPGSYPFICCPPAAAQA